jgi:hypothetical protein
VVEEQRHVIVAPDPNAMGVDWYVEATEAAQDYLVDPDEGDGGDRRRMPTSPAAGRAADGRRCL